jgi:hypothetical protein
MALSPYYAGHTWPDYVFREFPKMVDGVVVQNSDEELEVLTRKPAVDAPAAAPVGPDGAPVDIAALLAQLAAMQAKIDAMPATPVPAPVDADGVDERSELLGQAEARGIAVDRRWGSDRLRAALAGG